MLTVTELIRSKNKDMKIKRAHVYREVNKGSKNDYCYQIESKSILFASSSLSLEIMQKYCSRLKIGELQEIQNLMREWQRIYFDKSW